MPVPALLDIKCSGSPAAYPRQLRVSLPDKPWEQSLSGGRHCRKHIRLCPVPPHIANDANRTGLVHRPRDLRETWNGLTALDYSRSPFPGALPQVGMKPRLRRSSHCHCLNRSSPLQRAIGLRLFGNCVAHESQWDRTRQRSRVPSALKATPIPPPPSFSRTLYRETVWPIMAPGSSCAAGSGKPASIAMGRGPARF